jgi:hypothetical protein
VIAEYIYAAVDSDDIKFHFIAYNLIISNPNTLLHMRTFIAVAAFAAVSNAIQLDKAGATTSAPA